MKKSLLFSAAGAFALMLIGLFMISATPVNTESQPGVEAEAVHCDCPANARRFIGTVISQATDRCYRVAPCEGGSSIGVAPSLCVPSLSVGRTYRMCAINIGATSCADQTLQVVRVELVDGCP